MKDIVLITVVFLCAVFAGWMVGKSTVSNPTAPTLWYCIDSKVYEQSGDYYVTVVPARSCLPIDKE